MKFNWGTALFLLLGLFCITIVCVVIFAETGEIITNNYYQDDLQNHTRLQQLNNANELTEKVRFETAEDGLKIIFPEIFNEETKGDLLLMKYSDSSKDKRYQLKLNNEHFMIIPRSNLSTGVYEVSIRWHKATKDYLTIQRITWN